MGKISQMIPSFFLEMKRVQVQAFIIVWVTFEITKSL